MRRQLVLVLALSCLAGCALRPRYRDLSATMPEHPLKLRLLDTESGAPVAGAQVQMGEGSSRVQAVTGADGAFELPATRRFYDDNSLLVVELPPGVTHYRVAELPEAAPAPAAAPPVEAPPAPPAPPAEEAPRSN